MFDMLKLVILFSVFNTLNAVIYDASSGKPATARQIRLYYERNNTEYCAINIKPCDPNEWRRVDGSCNNLNYPSIGATRTPSVRLLTPDFSVDYEPRKAKTGEPLPLERLLRCELLQEGRAHDLELTQLVSYYLVFAVGDVVSLHDVLNYLGNTTDCCTPKGKSNYACTPNKIPVHDQVHRYSGVRCQNLTRPQSFQYFGCQEFGTTFSRIVFITPGFDLSSIYSYVPGSINHLRTFRNGLLRIDSKVFREIGKVFPPGIHTEAFNKENCLQNQYPQETLCYPYQPNLELGTNMLVVMFYRQHNYIANVLHRLNPCWGDERLFHTARDINIAVYTRIYIYELLPPLFGEMNLIQDNIIPWWSSGHRDLYDKDILPQMSDEFVYVNRWFHTMQETSVKLYDEEGAFLKTFPIVNSTTKVGLLTNDDNMGKMLRGSYRQPSSKFDYVIDFDMAERVLGGMNFASDVAMNDLAKGRHFGFPPYIRYRELCAGKSYKSFYDLRDVISDERLYRLRQMYAHVEDIDLMAGLWAENYVPGGKVPYTLYCLFIEQIKRTIKSDRHWFERPNRPHAFTREQLSAIKKTTIAGVICRHGDNIRKIQPNAFYTIHREHNPLEDCSSSRIGKLDLSPWKDLNCKTDNVK